MTDLLEDLRAFTAVPAPSGRETALADAIRARWSGLGPVTTDGLGNLSLTLGHGEPHIALVAHLDEVGFVVRRITDDGFVRLDRLGGIPERVLAMQELTLLGREGPITGVVGTWPHHYTPEAAKYQVPRIAETYLDIGARSAADVSERFGVRVGDYGVYVRNFRCVDDRVYSNALDDRAGLVALTALAERLASEASLPGRVSVLASVQEEFSIRGLVPTVRRVAPDVLVAVDVSPATDTPEVQGHNSEVLTGHGPVMHLQSFHGRGTLAGVLAPEWLAQLVENAAVVADSALQRASFFGGLTDGSFAQLENDGIATIELGVPVRYTHSPTESLVLSDLVALVDLLDVICREGNVGPALRRLPS